MALEDLEIHVLQENQDYHDLLVGREFQILEDQDHPCHQLYPLTLVDLEGRRVQEVLVGQQDLGHQYLEAPVDLVGQEVRSDQSHLLVPEIHQTLIFLAPLASLGSQNLLLVLENPSVQENLVVLEVPVIQIQAHPLLLGNQAVQMFHRIRAFLMYLVVLVVLVDQRTLLDRLVLEVQFLRPLDLLSFL